MIKDCISQLSLPLTPPRKSKAKSTAKTGSKTATEGPDTDPVGKLFLKQKPFYSILPAVNLFIEQEPVSGLAMNLDVNYRHVSQDNYFKKENTKKTMQDMIFTANGDLFQNSPIDLLFYEKIISSNTTVSSDDPSEVSSMSYCKLSTDEFKLCTMDNIDDDAYNLDLLVSMKNLSAKYVTNEEYKQLLFILGLKDFTAEVIYQDYSLVLSFLNLFHTSSKENFKEMLTQLQIPFYCNDLLTLAELQHEFKDFFLV